MSDPYSNLIVGKLKLKGMPIKKKSKKVHKKKETAEAPQVLEEVPVEEMGSVPTNAVAGSGRIYCTGPIVYGRDTKFLTELGSGDLFIIQHPTSLENEARVVKMIVSDTSLSLSSPFSKDFASLIPFEYVKKQEEEISPEEKQAQEKKERDAQENQAFGIYQGAGGTQFTYKTKLQSAYGGWKTITKKTKRVLTREEMLDMRVKHKSDRYCM
ncbi:hypothetical protein WA588_000170 [Blastocystis sp. NMH]